MARVPRFLIRAAKQLAADPRVREKAVDVFQKEVKPRAQAAWEQSKPKLQAAKAELKEIARETDPRKDPKKFASKLKERFLDKKGPAGRPPV